MGSPVRFGGALAMAIGITGTSCNGDASRPGQPPSAYRQQILADRPAAYWRLDEKAGTTAFDQAPATRSEIRTLDAGAGATSGDGDAAMFFNGSIGEVVVPSVRLWRS